MCFSLVASGKLWTSTWIIPCRTRERPARLTLPQAYLLVKLPGLILKSFIYTLKGISSHLSHSLIPAAHRGSHLCQFYSIYAVILLDIPRSWFLLNVESMLIVRFSLDSLIECPQRSSLWIPMCYIMPGPYFSAWFPLSRTFNICKNSIIWQTLPAATVSSIASISSLKYRSIDFCILMVDKHFQRELVAKNICFLFMQNS